MDAIRITAAGIETVSIPDPDASEHVTELQKAIGCHWFDVIRCDQGIDLWVDDEGMVNGSDFNRSATLVANLLGYPRPVFGNAVALASNENTGESLPLSAEQEATLRGILDVSAATGTDAR